MPMFARLGLLQTVEVSESNTARTVFASHSAGALGIIGVTSSSSDYFDLCLHHCSQELMFKLIGYHLNSRKLDPAGRSLCLSDTDQLSHSRLLSTTSCSFLPICKTIRSIWEMRLMTGIGIRRSN